ncbi:MAG: two-component regulator propeller domain-containing protein [Methanoregula sp.]|nr:two-component regulator propeller domain-containing protein [Methanoregula sp.]
MARPANSRILIFLLIVALVAPVSADLPDATTPSPGTGSPAPSVPYTITLFIPTATMVHSSQIMDLVKVPNTPGDVILATSFGLSTYNGTWSTRHMTLDNVSEGLMDDYITAVEYDRNGSLWIGYSGGIQIYNGRYYRTIRDPQLFKDTQIKDLQRWDDDMWVATGHAGIHRYRDGTWTWFQPFSPGGPGFYEVDSMAIDPMTDSFLIATEDEGLWIIRSRADPVIFACIAERESGNGLLNHVRQDPAGGVYFFNDSTVVHYSPGVNFTTVLTNRDLSITTPEINDLAAEPHGTLYLATDSGIFIWKNVGIDRHLDRFDGIGTSSVVQTITLDNQDRAWFSTQDDIGYYIDNTAWQSPLTIEMVTPVASSTPPQGNPSLETNPNSPEDTVTVNPTAIPVPEPEGIDAIFSPLIRAIKALFSGFGLNI